MEPRGTIHPFLKETTTKNHVPEYKEQHGIEESETYSLKPGVDDFTAPKKDNPGVWDQGGRGDYSGLEFSDTIHPSLKKTTTKNHGPECKEQYGIEETEAYSLMQGMDDSAAWYAFIGALHARLEAMDKLDRAVHVDLLLRRLDWHGTETDQASGYWLGHMTGRVGELTALLVAFQDGVEVDTEAPTPAITNGIWNEIEYFIPMHPGSNRRQGKEVSLEKPCIMIFAKEIPSELLTPGTTPPRSPRRAPSNRPSRKRTHVQVELSSGSGEQPRHSCNLKVPMNCGAVDLRISLKLEEGRNDSSSDTVPANPSSPAGTTLSRPAPGLLGNAGMSMMELWALQSRWDNGELTLQQLEACYGKEVAAELQAQWSEAGEGQEASGGPAMSSGATTLEEIPAERRHDGAKTQGEEETDETNLISTLVCAYTLGLLETSGGMEHEPTTMSLIREHLHRQRGEGTTPREQSSTLYHMVQNRGCREYLDKFPDLLEELDLPLDVNMAPQCLPGPSPFMIWVEAELWASFLDYYEAMVGSETEGLRALRGSETMPETEQAEWRRWAGLHRGPRRSPRSRTPRRTRQSSQAEERPWQRGGNDEVGDSAGDASSLMHRSTRSNSREGDRRRRRSRRWDAPDRERERSRGPRTSNPATTRDERIRERVTRETRSLVPSHCRSEWQDWQEWHHSGPRSEPATASTATRRTADTPGGELDLIQATGEWFVIMGLRGTGEEQQEPSNAITRQRQAQARTTLTGMSDRDLATMTRALMRLMGMLFIESARLLTQVQDTRRRNGELVEVEVEEDDDESIYMQQQLSTHAPESWEQVLQHLLVLAEQSREAHQGVLHGLRRRIENSLYLQTARGAQLQAVLVAATAGWSEGNREVPCDTEENDGLQTETWWARLKKYMDLGLGENGTARSSQEVVVVEKPEQGELTDPGHHPGDVEKWEEERQSLQEEKRQEESLQDWHEREDQQQEERDLQQLLEYEAKIYKDWENWEVLHTPSCPKRRRLVVSTTGAGSASGSSQQQMGDRAELWMPRSMDGFSVTLHVEEKPDTPVPPGQQSASQPMEPHGEFYDKTYKAWKNHEITDQGVAHLFGADWLFLFQIMRDGVGGEATLTTENMANGPATTQMDQSEGDNAMAGTGFWGAELRGRGSQVVELADSLEDNQGKPANE